MSTISGAQRNLYAVADAFRLDGEADERDQLERAAVRYAGSLTPREVAERTQPMDLRLKAAMVGGGR